MNSKWRGMRTASVGLLAVIFVFSLVGSVGAVSAAGTVITVDTFTDDMTVNGNCTLREAIQAANTDTKVDACPAGNGADTIQLSTGSYLLLIDGENEDQNQTGDWDIRSELSVIGAGQTATMIDGQYKDRVFHILPNGDLTLSASTVRHGDTGGFPVDSDLPGGGGLYNEGMMDLLKVNVTDNNVDEFRNGAGIYNVGTAKLDEVWVAYNREAVECDGTGGVWNNGVIHIEDSIIEYNSGGQGQDSFHNEVDGTATFLRVTVRHEYGRAGYNMINDGNLTIESSAFIDMEGEISSVLENRAGATAVIRSSTITGNSAMSSVIGNSGSLWIENSLLVNNTGSVMAEGGTLTILNSTLANSEENGVEIFEGTVWMNGVTIANNQYEHRGIYMTGGVLNAANTIITGSLTSEGDPMPDCLFEGGTFKSYGGNLVGDATGCGWVAGLGDQLGSTSSPIDPKLGALDFYGGTTKLFSLLASSPAMDTGSDTYCLSKDQRGHIRPRDGDGDGVAHCDIGAFEAESTQPDLKPQVFMPYVRH